jgi:hypothetical protein
MASPTSAYPAYPNPYPYPKQAATMFPLQQYAAAIQISPLTLFRELYGRRRMCEEHHLMEFRVRDIAKLFRTDYKKLYRCMVGIDEILTRRDLMFRFSLTERQAASRPYPKGIRYRNIVRHFAQETIDYHLSHYA